MSRKTTINIFYANPVRMEHVEAQHIMSGLAGLLGERFSQRSPGAELIIRVTEGLSDHEKYFTGDWDTWAVSVPGRRHPMTKKLMYDVFVATNINVGRSTYLILATALSMQKPVFWWNGILAPVPESPAKPRIVRVHEIVVEDPDNYKTGWKLRIPGIE